MDSEIETTLLQAALAGDSNAFSQLFEPYRRPLLLYGYRLLGSLEDAEDLVQDVSVRAWVKLATFERRASFRTWLYRITTHLGCDLIDTRQRRSLPQYRVSPASPEGLASLSDPTHVSSLDSRWLDPLPDTLLVDYTSEPETHYLQRESVTLAFLAVLQELPARQRAILLLRDVLEFRAREVADLLDLSTAAVESALQRARAMLARRSRSGETVRAPVLDPTTQRLLDRYLAAWETANIPALVELLHEEATLAMPPYPWWLQGRAAIAVFLSSLLADSTPDTWRLFAVGANTQPAYLSYRLTPEGNYEAQSVSLLTVSGQQIKELTCFLDPRLFQRFGFPGQLAD
jgi:RNA polymerase sigma-70 factor, ECF subfamily